MNPPSVQIETLEKTGAFTGRERGVACPIDGADMRRAEVIVNADDWGRDRATTDRTLDCFLANAISSVSAMVFMADSERAAEMACTHSMDAGLHLNFTAKYSAQVCNASLLNHQQEIARVLTAHRFSAVFYYPRLASSFEYLVKAQMDEYERLYGVAAKRLDGHDHMHLCANVLRQELLPSGSIVRRNLSFRSGEKHYLNRLYRRMQDKRLARRNRIADYLFDLHPTQPLERLQRIFNLGTRFNVEIETHPIRNDEYRFLMNGELQNCVANVQVAIGYELRSHLSSRNTENPA